MEITEISVEVGEVRNHPHEYGNYRCSVRLTSLVDLLTQDPMIVVRQLRAQARFHAVEECDEWEEEVREERRVSELLWGLNENIEQVKRWGHAIDDARIYADTARKKVAELPEDMRDHWYQEVQEALDWRIEEIRAQAEVEECDDVVDLWELEHPVEPPF